MMMMMVDGNKLQRQTRTAIGNESDRWIDFMLWLSQLREDFVVIVVETEQNRKCSELVWT